MPNSWLIFLTIWKIMGDVGYVCVCVCVCVRACVWWGRGGGGWGCPNESPMQQDEWHTFRKTTAVLWDWISANHIFTALDFQVNFEMKLIWTSTFEIIMIVVFFIIVQYWWSRVIAMIWIEALCSPMNFFCTIASEVNFILSTFTFRLCETVINRSFATHD